MDSVFPPFPRMLTVTSSHELACRPSVADRSSQSTGDGALVVQPNEVAVTLTESLTALCEVVICTSPLPALTLA